MSNSNFAGMHLLIIGDSITLGATEVSGDKILSNTDNTYVRMLGELAPRLRVTVDAAIHRTTADVLPLLDGLVAQHNPDAVLLMVGGNDADLNWRRFVITNGRVVNSVVSLQRYTQNLRQIVTSLVSAGILPLLTDMPNHDLGMRGRYISQLCGKDIMPMLHRCGGHAESDRRLAQYCHAAAQISHELRSPIVRFGEALAGVALEEALGPEGAHPNARADDIIALTLFPVLRAHDTYRRRTAGQDNDADTQAMFQQLI